MMNRAVLLFEIDRRRFAVRLTAPYSDERRKAASELAKKNGLKGEYKTALTAAVRRRNQAPADGFFLCREHLMF